MTNEEFNNEFRIRTRKFAVAIFKFLNILPNENSTRIISYQLGRAASSVGANFRAFCRGRSQKEKYYEISHLSHFFSPSNKKSCCTQLFDH